jgi:hypothetical protein
MNSVLFQSLRDGDLGARNSKIKQAQAKMDGGKNVKDLTPVAPMAVERLVTAQMNYYANNDQNVRSRTLFHATPIGLGWCLSFIARVIRVVVRTLGLIISCPVALFQQSRYGKMEPVALFQQSRYGKMENESGKILSYNIVLEDLKRVGQEWADLGTTLLSLPIGMINTIAPGAISTQFLYNYYSSRTEQNITRNIEFDAARTAYINEKTVKHLAWKNAKV